LLAYKLSSGHFGFLFNDASKIIVSKDFYQFYHIKKQVKNGKNQFKASLHTFEEYPAVLKPRLEEVKNFLGALNENQLMPSHFNKQDQDESFYKSKNIIYINKMKAEKKAIYFKLNNNVLQLVFSDSTEIIFCQSKTEVLVVTKNQKLLKAKLGSNFHAYFSLGRSDPKLNQKLIYAKEIYQKHFSFNKCHKMENQGSSYFTNISREQSKRAIDKNHSVLKPKNSEKTGHMTQKSHYRRNAQLFSSKYNSERKYSMAETPKKRVIERKKKLSLQNMLKNMIPPSVSETTMKFSKRNHPLNISKPTSKNYEFKNKTRKTFDNNKLSGKSHLI
jgi:hypothetical protein